MCIFTETVFAPCTKCLEGTEDKSVHPHCFSFPSIRNSLLICVVNPYKIKSRESQKRVQKEFFYHTKKTASRCSRIMRASQGVEEQGNMNSYFKETRDIFGLVGREIDIFLQLTSTLE